MDAWPVVPEAKANGCDQNEPGSPMSPASKRKKQEDVGAELLNEILHGARQNSMSGRPKLWVETTQADFFFGGWIVFNALILALETDLRTEKNKDDLVWTFLDSLFNVVFLIELLMRMYALRAKWARDLWNLFDGGLVTIGIADSWILPVTGLNADMRFITLMRLFRLLRLVRVLRVLRLLRFLRELMLLVQGITSAMRAMVWGLLLLGITIFICALLITRLVGKDCCDEDDTFKDEFYKTYFGTLSRTSFTLFQFTMEFQPDICRDTWDGSGPWLTFFFLGYTMFTNITLLNTVASVIVENILTISQQNAEEQKAAKDAEQQEETKLRIADIFEAVDHDGNRTIDRNEIAQGGSAVEKLLELSGVSSEYALELFSIMDVDNSGSVSREEFQSAVIKGPQPLEASDFLRLQCQMEGMKKQIASSLETVSKQNTSVLEALSNMQKRQEALEEKIHSSKQPPARDLDDMSISFVVKQKSPLQEPSLPPMAIASSGAVVARDLARSSAQADGQTDFQEETLLV